MKLKEWRLYRVLSQAELAELAGVTKSTIVALENQSERRPHPKTLRKLAMALQTEPGRLLERPDPEKEESQQ